jgi:hypothetical protein
MKTITLSLDEQTYKLFLQFAPADHRYISNMIETAAKIHLEKCLFMSDAEMRGIHNDKALVSRMKKGSRAAKSVCV